MLIKQKNVPNFFGLLHKVGAKFVDLDQNLNGEFSLPFVVGSIALLLDISIITSLAFLRDIAVIGIGLFYCDRVFNFCCLLQRFNCDLGLDRFYGDLTFGVLRKVSI